VRLPVLSARGVCRALGKIGYERHHQTGSHIILRRTFPPYRHIAVPSHHEVARGTPRAIIREVGLTVEEFVDLLD
jgi:predicted RNA binding protein YcfA (HicA-like mRNA interferase family)